MESFNDSTVSLYLYQTDQTTNTIKATSMLQLDDVSFNRKHSFYVFKIVKVSENLSII